MVGSMRFAIFAKTIIDMFAQLIEKLRRAIKTRRCKRFFALSKNYDIREVIRVEDSEYGGIGHYNFTCSDSVNKDNKSSLIITFTDKEADIRLYEVVLYSMGLGFKIK